MSTAAVDPRTLATLLTLVAPRAPSPPEGAVDWESLLALGHDHLLLPLLHHRLHAVPLPAAIRERLGAAHRESAAHVAMLAAEQTRAVERLAQEGIPTIIFKGLPLGERLYGDPTLRPTCDIDLIVPSHEMERAHARLRSLGWQARHRFEIHDDLVKRVGGIDLILELHWTSQRNGEFQFAEQRLWEETVQEGSRRLFSHEMTLVAMMLHAARHYFLPYRLLVDIAWAVAGWRERLDWERVASLAEEVEAGALLAGVLALVERDLGVAAPHVGGLDGSGRRTRLRLATGLLPPDRLLGRRRVPVVDRYLFPWLSGSPLSPRLLLSDLVRTPEQIAYIYRLPRHSPRVALYLLARPFLLTRKYLRRLRRS